MIIPSKHDGYGDGGRVTSTRRVFMDGGGSQPTSQSVTQTSIPEYARPYVENMLGKASALTNTSTNPYMQYQGERFAQFTPLQQQSYAGAATMTPSAQLGAGSDLASQAGQGGMNYANYTANSFTQPGAAAAYMSPYMQNVTDMQMASARRQADIDRQGRQARSVGAGAFGGSRQAIEQSEADRALGTQLGSIQAQGLQGAFNNAQQQFNTEQQSRAQAAGIGLQGLNTGLQGANTLGQLGQNQYTQQMGINQLQQQLGAGQQAQMQNILNAQQQDYLNAQNYPYKQLGFMSDILRGMPLSQTSQTMYQSPGSQAAQLAGIGLGVSGLFGGKAAGGSVSSYADGGTVGGYAMGGMDEQLAYNNEPVMRMADGGETAPAGTQTAFGFVPAMAGGGITNPQHVEGLISKLSDQQLKESLQIAINTGDKQREEDVRNEMAMRASEKAGMAAAYNQQPQGMMAEEPMYARGGIVAFAGPTEDNNYSTTSSDPMGTGASEIMSQPTGASDNRNLLERILNAPEDPQWKQKIKAEQAAKASARESKRSDMGISDYFSKQMESGQEAPKAEAPKLTKADNKLASTISKAVSTQTDMPFESIESSYKKAIEMMKDSGNDAGLKEIRDTIASLKKVPEFDRNAAIAKFGFQMAAAAAQPGGPRGLAGVVQAAAKAAPSISEALEAHNKDVKDAKRLGAQLTIEQAKYEAALRRGDQQTAMGLAQNMRMMQMQMAQLAESSRHNRATEGIQSANIGHNPILQIADRIKASDPKLSDFEAMQKASQIAGYGYRTDATSQSKLAGEVEKINAKFAPFAGMNSDYGRAQMAERDRQIKQVRDLYSGGGGGSSGPTQTVYDWNQQTGGKS